MQHLREACVAGSADHVVAQLAAVVNLLAQGRAPADVAPVLAGAGLGLKPAGGVRPIAVGEIVRRLTGKCLMAVVRADARGLLLACSGWRGGARRRRESGPLCTRLDATPLHGL